MDIIEELINKFEEDIEVSLSRVHERLDVTSEAYDTHVLMQVAGIDSSRTCLKPLAIYCVGQIAKAIQVNLEIKADLLSVEDDIDYSLEQLIRDLYSVIGENNDSFTDIQKRDERDPWLFEAISHLLIHSSTNNPLLLPVGELLILTPTHGSVKEKGLDLVALYEGEQIGLCIGECKTRESDPSGGLREAAEKFVEVDKGDYDADLRTKVGQLRFALSPEYERQISSAFWKNERSYIPFISYSADLRPRWTRQRRALIPLKVPRVHRLLLPIPLSEYRGFFDDLADEMRNYVKTLEGN